ncbi:pseudaminic acid cytidylyltransferase [Vibrio sinaloensis]|uniref:pseudaminic acid cytidylyltransferase n=1 Tax=Photobacterium sp. (strain ATCC 43367) TaxID=379097 RepID=UPI0035EBA90E
MRVAIIPARGGSKRIPGKNIKLFHNKPMIGYSIEAAKKSGCFDKVIVSTDDSQIAEVAISFGAEVPFIRPASISDDYSTTADVIKHALNWMKNHGWEVTEVCCIYATAPFIRAEDICRGLDKLCSEECCYVFSATTFPFPIQRAIRLRDEKVEMFDDAMLNIRSQDLEEAYHDAGQFYWGTSDAFQKGLPMFSSHSKVVLLPRKRVQDIDTFEDWEVAESMFNLV